MEVKGTREAFSAMIQERGIYKKLGVERSTVAGWKIYLREGKSISLDKMEEMLIKAGAIVAQEKVWKLDSKNLIEESMKTFNVTYTKKIGGDGHILVKAINEDQALANAKNLCATGSHFRLPVETDDSYVKPRKQGFTGFN